MAVAQVNSQDWLKPDESETGKMTPKGPQRLLYHQHNENCHHSRDTSPRTLLGTGPLPTRRQGQNLAPRSLGTTHPWRLTKSHQLTDRVRNSLASPAKSTGHVLSLLSRRSPRLATRGAAAAAARPGFPPPSWLQAPSWPFSS